MEVLRVKRNKEQLERGDRAEWRNRKTEAKRTKQRGKAFEKEKNRKRRKGEWKSKTEVGGEEPPLHLHQRLHRSSQRTPWSPWTAPKRQRREREAIKEVGKNKKWKGKKYQRRRTTTAATVLPLHRHSAPPWPPLTAPKRQRRKREDNEKNRGEMAEKRNRGDRREGRKTPPLSPPPSTNTDDHNRAFLLQVTFSPPLSFLVSSSLACRTWAIHVLQQNED